MSQEQKHGAVDVKAKGALAKAWIAARWADFRAESRFYQAKAAMVAAYVAIVVLTFVLAPPSAVPWEVKVGKIPFGIAFKSFIELKDVNAGHHEDLLMEVTGAYSDFDGAQKRGTWKKKLASIDEGQKLQLWPEDFKDLNGRSPANTLVVEEMRLLDADGDLLLRFPK
jgi:hypothetical protein